MAAITLRSVKGSPLTNAEVDANFSNLNTELGQKLTGNQTITLSGDASGSGATAITVTLANSGVAAGTYPKVTVDAKGRVTAGSALLAGDIPNLNYMLRSAIGQTDPNTNFVSSGYRFNPNANNPTNDYYAILTYGNEGNVTGQLATHYTTGQTFARAHNASWSAWRTLLDSSNFNSYAIPRNGSTWTPHPSTFRNAAYNYLYTDSGYVAIGPANSGWAHMQTDRARWYFGQSISVDGDIQRYSDSAIYLHSANYNSYALPLSGGTLTNNLTISPTDSRSNRFVSVYRGSLGADSAGLIVGTGSTSNWFVGHPYSGGGVFNALVISERELINDGASNLIKMPLMYFTPGSGTAAGNVGIGKINPTVRLDVDGALAATSHFKQGDNIARPNVSWSASSASTGMVIFYLPGTTSNYGMVHMVFDIYEYNSNSVSTVIVGGHNWTNNWYNVSANVIGQCGKEVRLGVKDGRFCVVFGTSGSTWQYGTIVLRKVHNGSYYNNNIDMVGNWSATQTTTESFTNVTGDLRALRTPGSFSAGGAITQAGNQVLHAGNFSSYSPTLTGSGASGTWGISVTGNAATATALQTARTINGVSFNGTANVTVTTAGTGIAVSGAAVSIAAAYSPNTATELPASQNLNDYQTAGFYYQTANADTSTANNYPVAEAGSFVVQRSAGVTQQYYTYNPSITEMYFRTFYNTTWGSWRRVLTSANYTAFSPSLTGSGASGTWGISITGNAATATTASNSTNLGGSAATYYDFRRYTDSTVYMGGYYVSGGSEKPNNAIFGAGKLKIAMLSGGNLGFGGSWNDVLWMSTYTGGDVKASYAIVGDKYSDELYFSRQNYDSASWGTGRRILHSGNYASYALPLSGGTVTGASYFQSNLGSTSGSLSSPPLQVYATGGNAAFMSFHRGSSYAVNMGLDSDNVLRIGGWSASANRLQMDMSGNLTMAGNVTAYSDVRLKKDWAPVREGFVELLSRVRAGSYTRIDSEERQAGVSAQEMREVLPECVSEDASGTLALAYGNAALVSAVELAKELVALKREIAALKSRSHIH